jgi:uncharacterized protein YutE (UPF0331/DUF86 family)
MSGTAELEMLQRVVPELEAEGFDVYIHPSTPLIPLFLADLHPDAIALRDDKNLVVEVMRRSPQASKKLERLTALLEPQKKWELRIFWAEPTSDARTLEIQSVEAMRSSIAEVQQIAAAGHLEPAMLIAWATFEALGRALLTTQLGRPQTPGRLVQVLASEGYLTPTEADKLRGLAAKRNRLIHGELQVSVSANELQDFASILETMIQQLTPPPRPLRP